jgi:prepilin-type N-terminal cleavage/methylation domain-containing protein
MHRNQPLPVEPRARGKLRAAIARMRWAAANDAGFTLIEILVSALIVALISAAVADGLIASAHLSGTERQRSQADQLAQQDQERLKGLSDQQLQGLIQTRTVKLDGYTYTVTSTSTFEDTSGASTCTSGRAAYFKVTSTAAWPPAGSMTEESIIRRTVDGGLRVQVDDESGVNPLSGVQVNANGPSNATGSTDPDGCFVFTGMTPGNYTVGVAAAGYVDKDGNSSPPNISATVAATGIAPTSNTPLIIGKGGSITASFATNTATKTYTVPGYYLSYFGSLGSSKMSASSVVLGSGAPVTSIPTATSHLFPFTSFVGSTYNYTGNYQVWAGQCASEQPLVPPPGIDIATVTPGSAVAATVGEPALDASITGNTAPLDVKITYSDGTCTDVWSPVASAGADPTNGYAVYPAPFASNAAKGAPTSNVPGVAGSLSFCVDYKSGPTTYRKQTITGITNTSFTAPTVLAPINIATAPTSGSPC